MSIILVFQTHDIVVLPGDFAVRCRSAAELLDALLRGADYAGRHVFRAVPRPGGSGSPLDQAYLCVARLGGPYDNDTLDLLCGAIFERASAMRTDIQTNVFLKASDLLGGV